jgi:hypothetical protein
VKLIGYRRNRFAINALIFVSAAFTCIHAQEVVEPIPDAGELFVHGTQTKFDFAAAPQINVATVEQLYSAVNDPANANSQIVIAAGTYALTVADPGGTSRPNGGRLELQENMSLRGVAGNRAAVIIDAGGLPASSHSAPIPNTGAIRLGKGTNAVEWLTVRNAVNGGAGIIVHLTAAGTAYARVAHCVATGGHRGIDIRNAAASVTGFIIEAEIVDNDLHANRVQTATGLRIINTQGVSGNSVSVYLSGNRMFDNQQGMIVENLGSTNGGIVSVTSNGDRFFENGGGATIGAAFGPTENSTVNFTAIGSVFENNNGFTNFYRGGLTIGGSVSFQTANGGSNNTANATLRNCRFSTNQVADLAVYGASSLPVSIGPSGTNNRTTVRLLGAPTANIIKADSSPANPAGTNFVSVTRSVHPDYDGDGRADISVFRPSDQIWYLNRSTDGFGTVRFGLSTDKLVPADYDGDGKTDVGVFRDGTWYWLNSSNNQFNAFQFGFANDIPQPEDFDGDGRAEIVVMRDRWYVYNLANNRITTLVPNYCDGLAETVTPTPGDYDGDGRADYAVYCNFDGKPGEWEIEYSAGGSANPSFGVRGDKAVPADYDGDGKTDIAVFRPSTGTWFILRSGDLITDIVNWGVAGDRLAPGDYDGDGKADIAIFRDGTWWIRQSRNGISIQQFGLNGDRPVPAAFLP